MTINFEDSIEIYLKILGILFMFFFAIALIYWIKLIKYLFSEKPKYWKKLYTRGIFPKRINFFKFYYGHEDFNDKKIKKYKRKFRFYSLISLIFFLLILLSIIFIGIFI